MHHDLQYYFDIADSLLHDLDAGDERSPRDADVNRCSRCHGCHLVLCYADGCYVCSDCGEVSMQPVFEKARTFIQKFSNYKRIHHFHERISQFMLAESCIPEDDMQRIKEAFKASSFTSINKTNIRKVLRSLKMQKYIEKWLQIIFKITGAQPPVLTPRVCTQLDLMFIATQLPFMNTRPKNRKNFLNYNYVFNRLLQKLELTEFCMFFPLIKSKTKLAALDQMWYSICTALKWEYTQLRHVKPFCIKLNCL